MRIRTITRVIVCLTNAPDYDELNFETCDALRSVVLAGPLSRGERVHQHTWDTKLEVIKRLPFTIEYLGIEVPPQTEAASVETHIARLGPVLSERFTQLQRIVFGPSYEAIMGTKKVYTAGPETGRRIRRILHGLDALGVLEWRCPFAPVRVSSSISSTEIAYNAIEALYIPEVSNTPYD